MTREEFDKLPSHGTTPCPDCGKRSTHPTPGCSCPSEYTIQGLEFTRHINLNHHTCDLKEKEPARGVERTGTVDKNLNADNLSWVLKEKVK